MPCVVAEPAGEAMIDLEVWRSHIDAALAGLRIAVPAFVQQTFFDSRRTQ
jgi:hypothetical protein